MAALRDRSIVVLREMAIACCLPRLARVTLLGGVARDLGDRLLAEGRVLELDVVLGQAPEQHRPVLRPRFGRLKSDSSCWISVDEERQHALLERALPWSRMPASIGHVGRADADLLVALLERPPPSPWKDICGALPWATDWMAGPSGHTSTVVLRLVRDADGPDELARTRATTGREAARRPSRTARAVAATHATATEHADQAPRRGRRPTRR